MNVSVTKHSAPGMEEEAVELYTKLYGNAGERFVEILNESPNEIAVISRLIAYLKDKKGGMLNGSEENGTGNRSV